MVCEKTKGEEVNMRLRLRFIITVYVLIYYCKIVAMGDLKFCMDEFKKLEGYTLKYPLNVFR